MSIVISLSSLFPPFFFNYSVINHNGNQLLQNWGGGVHHVVIYVICIIRH